jgi:integration host factor subunit alpha
LAVRAQSGFSGRPNGPGGNLPFAFFRGGDMFPATPRNQEGAVMTLTKDNLIQTLYDQSGFSKHQSKALVEEIFEMVKQSLESGDDVLISGFGKFSAKKKSPRRGRNPATVLKNRDILLFLSSLHCSPQSSYLEIHELYSLAGKCSHIKE